ncbi:hypothetical protein [Flavobacterium sp. 3HN19-14]|uniref:hypothetical protein n=1 Tax=Flavobacterium sp. 3HN19-14 TaxID=3448133 RepID=UPI003EE3C2E7
MVNNSTRRKLQLIFSAVIAFFCVFQIISVLTAYFQQKAAIKNPLIPESLIIGVRNFTIFVVISYLLILIANVFCLYKKQYFYVVQIVSFAIMLLFQFCYPQIIDFFLST